MKSSLLFIISLLFSITSIAQQSTVKGTITAKDGEKLVGVSIFVKGSTIGTYTDVDGNYTINIPTNLDELVFSYVSYKEQTVKLNGRSVLDIVMESETAKLDEVVVIGFGTARKSDLTSSISSVKSDELKEMTVGNVNEILQGRVAGLQVVGGGTPGSQPKVFIRGFSTVSLSTDPLYVVDGVPMGNSISFLNPNEIESMEILKDASASAIYGSRASNGVIMITTKKGKEGKTRFNVDVSYGYQTIKKPYEMANAVEYATIFNKASEAAGQGKMFDEPNDYIGKTTDWWAAGIRDYSPQMNLGFTMQGGSEKNTYAVSLNYFKQESFYDKGGWDRFTARISSDYKLSKYFSAGYTINPRIESYGTPDVWQDFLRIDPITPIYKPANELTGDENEYSIFARSPSYVWNPVAAIKRWNWNEKIYALSTTGYIQFSPIKQLVVRSQGGFDFDTRQKNVFTPDFSIDPAHEVEKYNKVERNQPIYKNWSLQNTITYMETFAKSHNVSVMLGNTLEEWMGSSLWGTKLNIPNNSDPLRELDAATLDPATGGSSYTNSILSYLGRISYNYKYKYYLTATYRRDGSSKFMSNNKWASFPSASFAWRVSNEDFMNFFKPLINDLKFRAGWGRVGNQNLPGDVYLSKLNQGYYVFGGNVVNTVYPGSMKNEDIKWETVEDYNLGLDFGLFGNKITGSAEYYVKDTKDMLFQKYYPSYSGYPDDAKIWSNVGSMRSHGYELSLNYNDKIGDFKYSIGYTLTSINVKMKALTGDKEPLYGKDGKTKTIENEVPGFFYGYVADGLFQNQTELNSHTNDKGEFLQPYAQLGDIRFKDLNGDGKLDDQDRTKIGSPWADFLMGLNLNFEYKGFDLAANFYASLGNDLVNTNKDELHNAVSKTNKVKGLINDSWHGEGTSFDIPRLSRTDNNQNYEKFSSFYIEDGSYLRLKNIQLGYTLPEKIVSKLSLQKVRLSISAQNLFTLTRYKGVDPEVAGGVLDFGFGGWNYPALKTYLFGINVSF